LRYLPSFQVSLTIILTSHQTAYGTVEYILVARVLSAEDDTAFKAGQNKKTKIASNKINPRARNRMHPMYYPNHRRIQIL
jgi:hypothetical protein